MNVDVTTGPDVPLTETSSAAFARKERGYEGTRPDIQQLVPHHCRRILELGCSTGALGEALKRRQGAMVVGVELDEGFASSARARLDRVLVDDVERFAANPPADLGSYDCLIAADVLEHLVDPWTALARTTQLLTPGATVVVSVPNVLYWRALRKLVLGGRWPREPSGIFDATHLRWFSERDAVELATGAGVTEVDVHPSIWVKGWRRRLSLWALHTPGRRFAPAQTLVRGRMPPGV